MGTNAKVSFYSIKDCGYYLRGQEIPEFGNIQSILAQLQDWASSNDMNVRSTQTYQVEDSGLEQDIFPTYCLDISHDASTGDFLLITWNEVPHDESGVASVRGSEPIGTVEVEHTRIPNDSIPGFPTYFWFIPEFDVFSTIQFGQTVNGQQNMVKYIKGFLARYSHHVNSIEGNDGEIFIVPER